MEKIIDKNSSIIEKNERLIANILHDVKSPLYSIKIGLATHLDNELNQDIYETTLSTINYIEDFLISYNFKNGKFENNIAVCDIKEIICEKTKCCKYILMNKNIQIDVICDKSEYKLNSIKPFISSIIGNLVSNIAFHGKENENAIIKIYKMDSEICIDFQNKYSSNNSNFSLGLNFCNILADYLNVKIDFFKTSSEVKVSVKIPNINC